MREWAEFTIEQLGKVITGKTPSKDNPEEWGDAYNFITPSDYGAYNKLALSSIRKLSDTGYFKHKSRLIPANSLLVTCIGSDMGKVVKNVHPSFTNQQINSFIPNENLVNSDFIYYFFKSSESYLKNLGSDGSAVPILNKSTFQQIVIELPPFLEQQAIASVLSALDDKIDLLQRQTQTLEQMAATLFRQWFIEEGREDWEERPLGDLLTVKRGGSPRPIQDYLSDSGYRWLKISDVTSLNTPYIFNIREHIKEEGLKKTTLLKAGKLVLSNSATPAIPKILMVDSCIHDGWLHFPKSHFSNEFLYLLFNFIRPQLLQLGNGSIFTNLKTDILKEFVIKVPDDKALENFQSIVSRKFEKILLNTQQIQTLQSLRDTLLPKLISGEVRLKGFETLLQT